MLFQFRNTRARVALGISLVEILISLTIFSTALVGLFMGINGVNQAIGLAMRRDIEASYANMLIAEVNPYARDIEGDYNEDSTESTDFKGRSCGNLRCSIDLPYGEKIYYTRDVRGVSATQADVKAISVYLYRSVSGGSPYRQFRKEVAPKRMGYIMTCSSNPIPDNVKDPSGLVWARMEYNDVWNLSGTHKTNGTSNIASCGSTASSIANTLQYTNSSGTVLNYSVPFQHVHDAGTLGTTMTYKFLATQDQLYTIKLGFAELAGGVTAGQRLMEVRINDQLVGTVDPVAESGSTLTALVKTYTAKPILDSGVYVLKISLVNAGSATLRARLNNIVIERTSD